MVALEQKGFMTQGEAESSLQSLRDALKITKEHGKIPGEIQKEVDRSGSHVPINNRDNIVDHEKGARKKQNRTKSCDPSNASTSKLRRSHRSKTGAK